MVFLKLIVMHNINYFVIFYLKLNFVSRFDWWNIMPILISYKVHNTISIFKDKEKK